MRLVSLMSFFLSLGALARGETASIPAPLTDNTRPPYLGVYEACVAPGIKRNGEYAKWLNRTNVWGHDTLAYGPGGTWEHISGRWQGWFYDPWSAWIGAGKDRRMVISVPLLPGPADRSGPTQGDRAGHAVSLAEGASGAYNGYFRGLAETLVRSHLGNSILRLGWEWNGNWYAWQVDNVDDAHHFAAYWRQIVDSMRAVPGAENLKYDWNVTIGFKTSYAPTEAYPGDDYVDYIGIDVYDQTWLSPPGYPNGLYPIPIDATATEIRSRHATMWQDVILPASNFGIEYWQKLADNHHKPLTIPEWGLIRQSPSKNHGGGDDPDFIQHMHDYILDPNHQVYFASYFDCETGDGGNSCISLLGVEPAAFSEATNLYRELFALPPALATPKP